MSLKETDRVFREIIDNGGFPPVEDSDEFDRGGHGRFPSWSTHVIAFLSGGIVFTALVFAPLTVPFLFGVAVVGFVFVAVRRRWR